MKGAKKIKQGEISSELTFSDFDQWVKDNVPSGTYDTYPFDAQALFDAVRNSVKKSILELGVDRFKQYGKFFSLVCSLSKTKRIEHLQKILLSKEKPRIQTKRDGKEYVLYYDKEKDVYPLVKKFFNMLDAKNIQDIENVLIKTIDRIDSLDNLRTAEKILKKYASHLDKDLEDISFLNLLRFGKIFKLAKLIDVYEFSDYYEKQNIDNFVNFIVDIGISLHYVHITEDKKEKIESNKKLLDLLNKLYRVTASIHRDVGKSREYDKHASIFYNKFFLKSKKISENNLDEKIHRYCFDENLKILKKEGVKFRKNFSFDFQGKMATINDAVNSVDLTHDESTKISGIIKNKCLVPKRFAKVLAENHEIKTSTDSKKSVK